LAAAPTVIRSCPLARRRPFSRHDEGLKDVYKGFHLAGDELVARLRAFRRHGVHVLGSFIFGLPSDRPSTFETTVALAKKAELTFAQFVLLTPFPGTLDFEKWAANEGRQAEPIDGVRLLNTG